MNKLRLERRIRESELRYRTVVDNSSDGVGMILDGKLAFMNPVLAAMVTAREGGGGAGADGQPDPVPFASIFGPGNRDALAAALEDARRGAASSGVLATPDGERQRKFGYRLCRVALEGRPAFIFMTEDITARSDSERMMEFIVERTSNRSQIALSLLDRVGRNLRDLKKINDLDEVKKQIIMNALGMRAVFKISELFWIEEKLHRMDIVDSLRKAVDDLSKYFPAPLFKIEMQIDPSVPAVLAGDSLPDLFLLLFISSWMKCPEPPATIKVKVEGREGGGAMVTYTDPNFADAGARNGNEGGNGSGSGSGGNGGGGLDWVHGMTPRPRDEFTVTLLLARGLSKRMGGKMEMRFGNGDSSIRLTLPGSP